ncbi:hypothetical protein J6TS7_38240 [Paenibacillus dendritiformis]|uniref:hypothetical protein n=1 Tax=Paenibacillus TaxID=44249 RepID=UPI001B0AEB74|nr:hypothetical protein [Paenibacillus dendritiformis]GIO80214.1 hypothetical protein J6TS7_38240 [Paenibacillus dendritiformis]
MMIILDSANKMCEKVGQKMFLAGVNIFSRSKSLAKDERGGLFEFIFIALIVVVILAGVYAYAKTEIDTFMQKIFGKMNNIS